MIAKFALRQWVFEARKLSNNDDNNRKEDELVEVCFDVYDEIIVSSSESDSDGESSNENSKKPITEEIKEDSSESS